MWGAEFVCALHRVSASSGTLPRFELPNPETQDDREKVSQMGINEECEGDEDPGGRCDLALS